MSITAINTERWASWVSNPFLQDLASRYFAWKVRRKFGRYKRMIENAERLKKLQEQFRQEESNAVR
jgi:sulfur transfer protein SufE